jgi:secreted Zn-dependent insulinase-like peptidase
MYSLFWVSVTLTIKGLANWIFVAKRVHQYVALIRRIEPQEWIFREMQRIAQIKYGTICQ